MNHNPILTRARELAGSKDGELLWFLHSRRTEDGDFNKVATEIDSQFGDALKTVKRCHPGRSGLSAGDLAHLLKEFMDYGHLPGKLHSVLRDFYESRSADIKRHYHLTNIGSKVWETLDWCLEERRPCFVEGREGRGKSSSGKAWYEAHRGQSRYVSLPGLRTQKDFFEAVASAYDVKYATAKAPGEIRGRVRDMIIGSGLVLIIDEAHHALPEPYRASRPRLIDWIDCDLCNAGVPVALVSTPQFGPLLSEFESRTHWNAGQFRRRFSGRWTCLPEQTAEDGLVALAQQAMPQVGNKGITLAVGYAGTFGRDVSGLFDLVRDAQRRARKANRSAVTYQDLKAAFDLDRVPSENAMADSFARSLASKPNDFEEPTLPDAGEPIAAPLPQRGSRPAAALEFPTPLRGRHVAELVS